MTYTFQKLGRDCPLCGGVSRGKGRGGGDCRQSGDLVFCRTALEQGTPAGWKLVKEDKHSFGIFAPNLEGTSEEYKQEYKKRKEQEKQERLEAERIRKENSLPLEERHRAIQGVLGQLPLRKEHRENLRNRGLTDWQITKGSFRSVNQWQKLDREVNHFLAGVNIGGRSLMAPQPGYICPVWDVEGNLVAWQTRADENENGSKYLWATSKTRKRPNGPTVHLKNGELPITVTRSNEYETFKQKTIRAIYTNASCYQIDNFGGYGIYVEYTDDSVAKVGGFKTETTTSEMELKAVITALEIVGNQGQKQTVNIFCDSEYIVKCINDSGKRPKKKNKDIWKNKDLWEKLDALISKKAEITYINGFRGNEKASEISNWCRNNQQEIKDVNPYLIGSNKTVGIVEGILKPYVASKKLNIDLIGAAGGNHAQSPQQLEDYLAKLKVNTVILYPDAGGVKNSQVHRRDSENVRFIQSLGYEVKIANWGQLYSSEEPDLDELDSLNAVKYLSPKEYLSPEVTEKTKNKPGANQISRSEWEFLYGIPRFIQEAFSYLTRLSSSFKGFIPRVISCPPENNCVQYTPGNIPKYKPGKKLSKFVFEEGYRGQFYKEAHAKGWKFLVDTSRAGTGKTYTVGKLTPTDFFPLQEDVPEEEQASRQLLYFLKSARSPHTKEIEEKFAEAPTRHKGLIKDPEKTTPLGNPVRKQVSRHERQKLEEEGYEYTEANCEWADKFAVAREKENKAKLCGICPFKKDCVTGSGNGYGYLNEVQNTLAHNRIRANPQGMSPNMISNPAIAVVDEYRDTLEPVKDVHIDKRELEEAFAFAKKVLEPEEYKKLLEVKDELHYILSDNEKAPRYGWDYKDICDRIGNPPEGIDQIIETLDEVVNERLRIDVQEIREEDSVEDLENRMLKNWIITFLEVWTGDRRGSLHLTNNHLTISTRNEHMLDVLNKPQMVIFQDATGNRDDVALIMDRKEEEVLWCEQEAPNEDNLKIKHVQGLGKASKDRRDQSDQRLKALEEAFIALYGKKNIGFIDWKDKGKKGWLNHFNDARGSNKYENKKAVASFGAPIPALTACQIEYQVLTGEYVDIDNKQHERFWNFVHNKIAAEVNQEIGRLRAHRRPNEQLTFYVCADIDLTFLREQGYDVEEIDAFELAFEAGTPQQQLRWKLLEGFRSLKESDQKITTEALSEEAECSKGRISQIAKPFGGWRVLRKCLGLLYKRTVTTLNSNELDNQPSEEIEFLAHTYLPEVLKMSEQEAEQELGTTLPVILDTLSFSDSVSLLVRFVETLPHRLRDEAKKVLEQLQEKGQPSQEKALP